MRRPYLDGLRGWAAVVVLLNHLVAPFLSSPGVFTWTPIDGILAVYLFFVLSGYVLSIGYLESNNRSLLTALAIRRYPRLTIPVLASCIAAYFLVELGAMQYQTEVQPNGNTWFSALYHPDSTLASVFRYAMWEMYFDWNAPPLNPVLWSMRTELIGSFLVLGVLRVAPGPRSRIAINSMIAIVLTCLGSPSIGLVAGSLVADLTRRAPQSSTYVLPCLTLFAALGLAMIRSGWLEQPAGMTLLAVAILISVMWLPTLRASLQTPISRWLGTISFPLYLTHMLIVCAWTPLAVILLRNVGVPSALQTVAAIASSIVIALLLASAFMPVERFSIAAGRYLSARLMSNRQPTATA